VLSIHGVAGNVDMIIELQARDMEHFTDLVIDQIYGHKYVMNSTSYIFLDTKR
jgi:DNA-binding Lrp family transcriptional regulator